MRNYDVKEACNHWFLIIYLHERVKVIWKFDAFVNEISDIINAAISQIFSLTNLLIKYLKGLNYVESLLFFNCNQFSQQFPSFHRISRFLITQNLIFTFALHQFNDDSLNILDLLTSILNKTPENRIHSTSNLLLVRSKIAIESRNRRFIPPKIISRHRPALNRK